MPREPHEQIVLPDRHHFHFFANREINSLYLTIAFLYFAEGLLSIFVPAYLWGLGLPLWYILLFYFLKSVAFIVVIFTVLPFLGFLSDKTMMAFSIPFFVLYYAGLSVIADYPALFFILPVFHAAAAFLFAVGYQIDFAGAADEGHVGTEVGMRYMVGALSRLAAPFLGGILITIAGFNSAFALGGFLLFLGVFPLFFFPRRRQTAGIRPQEITQFITDKRLIPFNISAAGYAAETSISQILWPLFIFLSIGSVESLGAIASLGLLGSAVITALVGFLSDHGKRRKIITITSLLFSMNWLLRPYAATNTFSITASAVGGDLVNAPLMVAWSSQYYKLARAYTNPILFILSRELIYDLVRIPLLAILIVLAYIMPIGTFFTISFIAASIAALLFLFANRLHTKDIAAS